MNFRRTLMLTTLLCLLGAHAKAEPALIIVVRHAERAAEPKDDPGLSPAGLQRARALAEYLSGAQVTSILTTQYLRTMETAAPTAKRFGLAPQVVPVKRGEAQAHVPEVIAAVRRLTGVVLVVGHSNTVAGIVAGLSPQRPEALCESSFAKVFLVVPQPSGSAVLQFEYGQPDPAPTLGCQ